VLGPPVAPGLDAPLTSRSFGRYSVAFLKETALKPEARAPKIVVAIRPRRPVEAVEVFMVVSQIVDKDGLDLPDGPWSLGSDIRRLPWLVPKLLLS
jgi:hypothetical protein